MANPALVCDECGILLYFPSTNTGAPDTTNARRLTAKQKSDLNILCCITCPSRLIIQDSGIMEDVQMEQPSEQSGDVQTLDPSGITGGLELPLSNNGELQQPPQEEHHSNNSLELGDFPQEIDGKPIYTGRNPCRRCFQSGIVNCSIVPGSEKCAKCHSGGRSCHKSLAGARPTGMWEKVTVLDYSPPFILVASRTRRLHDPEEEMLEYYVNYAYKGGGPAWRSGESEILKAYPGALKKFHRENPDMPGPPSWLVEEEDDDFFYGESTDLPM